MKKVSVLALVIVIAVGGGYAYTYSQVNNALQSIEMEFYDITLGGFSLIPPSLDITVALLCSNPTRYEIELSGNIDIYYGDSYITTFEISDVIRANGHSVIECPFHLSSISIVNLILEGFDDWTYSSSITATHRIFGIIPVVITKSL